MARKKATTFEEIVDTAAKLFEQNGYQNTTLDHIAAALRISKPTIYAYVPSKIAILEAIFADVLRRRDEVMAEVEAIEDPWLKLRRLTACLVEISFERASYMSIFQTDERELDEATQQKVREWARHLVRYVEGILRDGQALGYVRAEVDPVKAARIFGSILSSVFRWANPKRDTVDGVTAQIMLFVDGLVDGAGAISLDALEQQVPKPSPRPSRRKRSEAVLTGGDHE